MKADLVGTTTLIVGGAGAMGSALARRVVQSGGGVVLSGRDEASLARVAGALGPGVRTIAADASTADGGERIATAGRVDHVAVTMSSGGSAAASIPTTDLDGFRSAFNRLWAAHNLLHLAPRFVASSGSTTLLSGSSGRRPGHGFDVWTVVHGAIEALAKAAAIELAPRRVNVVSPGGIGLPPDRQLVEHAGTPDDIAVAFLSLIANPAITGGVLDVDGGERLGTWSGR